MSDLQGRCNEKGKVSISCINEALLQNELLKKEVLFSKKIEVSKIGKKKNSNCLEDKNTAFSYREEWGGKLAISFPGSVFKLL